MTFAHRHIAALAGSSAPILPSLDLQFANSEALDGLVTFTRASVAFNHDSAGVLQEISSGVARVNSHIYDGANWINRGFLIEDTRTNSLFPSQDLTGTWVNINTDEPTTNNADPTGGTTAVEVAATSTADQQFAIYRSFTGLTAGQDTAISVYVDAGTNATFAQLVWDADGGGTDGAFCNFNLSTGARGSITPFVAGTATDCGVEDLGGGFYRLWIVAKIAAGTVGRLTIGIIDRIDAVGFEAADLADNDSIIPWGVQVEIDEIGITSYMGETTSGTIVREADIAKVDGSNFSDFYNQFEGTVLIEFTLPTTIISRRLLVFWNGVDLTPIIALEVNTAQTGPRLQVINGSEANISVIHSWSPGDTVKMMASWAVNDFAVTSNGNAVSGDTSGNVPSGLSELAILYRHINGLEQFGGHVASIQFWRVALDNGYLIARSQ